MQIQLKQLEIEKALKAYITGLGIDLTGKVVTIAFTSGRKDNGLSADIEFEDVQPIPGFSDGTPTPVQSQQGKPLLVVPSNTIVSGSPTPEQVKAHFPEETLCEPNSIPHPEDLPLPVSTKPVSLFSK